MTNEKPYATVRTVYRRPIEPYRGNDGREKFLNVIECILNKKTELGFILVFTEDSSWDFAHNVTINQVRDGLLSYARDLAAYDGDDKIIDG